jgi:Fe-S-cluster containining protein
MAILTSNIIKTMGSTKITKDTPLDTVKELGKECDRCNNCCRYDTGIVLESDIPRIAQHMKLSVEEFKKQYLVQHEKFNTSCYKFMQEKIQGKPYGKCIMLDDKKGCTIHAIKPLHCKVCSTKSKHGEELTQWFALNYLVNINDPESIRQWALYLKYNRPIRGGKLEELVPNKEQLKRILGYELLK